MKRRWIFCSIAAVQFPARSEAVIDPKMLRFSVCQAGVQRYANISITLLMQSSRLWKVM
jgi:hypothetical protein